MNSLDDLLEQITEDLSKKMADELLEELDKLLFKYYEEGN